MGAVTGSGVFWVVELKRDPHAPFDLAVSIFIFKLLLGHDTSWGKIESEKKASLAMREMLFRIYLT